jgi:hypothetical protein
MSSGSEEDKGVVVHDAAALERTARSRRISAQRWWIHLSLIVTVCLSLAFEPVVLTIHIVIGLAFVGLAGIHLAQRRHTSIALARRLPRPRLLSGRSGRLALADLLLLVITAAMFASGMWDWLTGHPTRIRWHALTGVALGVLLLLHTVRRRSRLRASRIR